MTDFTDVEIVLPHAKGIAFDGCHKIYVLMDKQQVEKMRGYGYGDDYGSYLFTADEMSKSEMLGYLDQWFAESCSLRFIQAVSSVPEGTDPNEGFSSLIEQGFDWEEYEDEDED